MHGLHSLKVFKLKITAPIYTAQNCSIIQSKVPNTKSSKIQLLHVNLQKYRREKLKAL